VRREKHIELQHRVTLEPALDGQDIPSRVRCDAQPERIAFVAMYDLDGRDAGRDEA
jgi:hypothetical protein